MTDYLVLYTASIPLLMVILAFIIKGRVFKQLAIWSLVGMAFLRFFWYGSTLRSSVIGCGLKGLNWDAYSDGASMMTLYYAHTMFYPMAIAILFAILFFRSMRHYSPGKGSGFKRDKVGSK